MSSVTPSSDASSMYNYFAKTIREMDDQARETEKHNRKLREEEINRLEEGYTKTARKNQEEANETIEKVKGEYSNTLSRERQTHAEAMEDLKEKTQRELLTGGNAAIAGKYYKKAFNELEEEHQNERRHIQKTSEKVIQDMDKSHRNDLIQREKDMAATIKNVKAAASEAIALERDQHQGELDKIKNSTYNQRGQIMGISPEIYKKQMDDLQEGARVQHQEDMRHANEQETRLLERMHEIERKSDNRIKNLTRNQIDQVNNLEGQIKELNAFNSKAAKHLGAERAEMVKEHEESERADRRRLNDAFNLTNEKLHQDLSDKDEYYQRLNRDIVREKEAHASKVIQEQNLENRARIKDLESTYKAQIGQLEKDRKHFEKRADDHLEDALHKSNLEREKALGDQAKNYQDTIAKIQKADKGEIELLQKELKKHTSATDASMVSPGAEAQIRNSVIQEYQKALNMESDKHRNAIDEVQQKYADAYRRKVEFFEDRQTRTHHDNNMARTRENAQYVDALHEVEARTSEKVNQSEIQHEKEKDHLYRQFGHLMERQRRSYENTIEINRADAEARLSALRSETTSQAKMAQRAFTARQNEIIREYEKKLADQKTEADFKLEDVKAEAQIELRATERRAKQELEAQARGYEQRLAQLEAQNKERERYITQNYQEEIDRTRRSHELLSKKKS